MGGEVEAYLNAESEDRLTQNSLDERLANEAMCEELPAVAALLEQGANANTRNSVGEPILFEAASGCSADILALLLVYRADPWMSGFGEKVARTSAAAMWLLY